MGPTDYWQECIAIAFEEHGVSATPEQIKAVAADVEGAHDSYGMAFYRPPAGEHYRSEIDDLNRKLKAEREKVGCRTCGGSGRVESRAGVWHVNSPCPTCHGEGKHAP